MRLRGGGRFTMFFTAVEYECDSSCDQHSMPALPLQVELSCLSVPCFLNADPGQVVMEHDAFSRSGSSHSTKGHPSAEQTTSTIEFAAEILARNQVSDSGHTQPLDQKDGDTCTTLKTLEVFFEPVRILRTPMSLRPKRFPLTFWRSAALRLLKRAAKAAASHITVEVIE